MQGQNTCSNHISLFVRTQTVLTTNKCRSSNGLVKILSVLTTILQSWGIKFGLVLNTNRSQSPALLNWFVTSTLAVRCCAWGWLGCPYASPPSTPCVHAYILLIRWLGLTGDQLSYLLPLAVFLGVNPELCSMMWCTLQIKTITMVSLGIIGKCTTKMYLQMGFFFLLR